MSDQWQTRIAQLNLDLMEVRVAKAEVIKRMREVSAELHQTRCHHRDQIQSHKEQVCSLQDHLHLSMKELGSAKEKIEQQNLEIVDYQTALRHRSETEQSLRQSLCFKENELLLKDESATQYAVALQNEIATLNEENRTLRATLSSEQRAGVKTRQDLEASQSQVISLHSQIAKMKAEIGVLRANWQNERSRVLQLDNGQVAAVMKDRDHLRSQLENLEKKLSSVEFTQEQINEKNDKIESLSKEMTALKAGIEAKDNIISKLDAQLAILQSQLHESFDHVQGQNTLIEDLYRRLKDSENCTGDRHDKSEEFLATGSERDVECGRFSLFEIWRDLDATLVTVNSVLGIKRCSVDSPPSDCNLSAVQALASDLRQRVTTAAAAHVGQSCAMQ